MAVALIDTGCSNLFSVQAALDRLGATHTLARSPAEAERADRLILPGVGAAGPAMARLRASGWVETLQAETRPMLGICLGMQLLFEHSEEGDTTCLGVVPGQVRRIEGSARRRVPHMGWNRLDVLTDDPLLGGLGADAHAYFVHSYAVASTAHTLASTDYGSALAAVVRHRNFYGMQFHPERSAAVGARLLRNFLDS